MEETIDSIKQISVLKMPKQRAIKLVEYLYRLGEPRYFNGLEVSINEYGDVILSWERRQYEIEVVLTGAGSLKFYKDILGNSCNFEIPTVRRGAAIIHRVWKDYGVSQRRLNKEFL